MRLPLILGLKVIFLVGKDVQGSSNRGKNSTSGGGGPFGSILEVNFMIYSTATDRSLLFTHDNSTLFTSDVPLPPPDGVWGELIPFSPLDACSPLELSNYTLQVGSRIHFAPVGPYPHVVALVARGNCSFEEKFKFVDDVPNVIGMLMYDFEDGKNLSSFIEVTTFADLNIPGSLIEYEPGVQLRTELDRMRSEDRRHPKNPQWMKVTLKYIPHMSKAENLLQYTLLVVMLALCIAFILSVYMHYHIYRMQRRLDENRHMEARNAINIDETFLEKLPVRQFRKLSSPISVDLNDGAGVSKVTRSSPQTVAPVEEDEENGGIIHATAPPNETCPICLDEFGQFETLNELPCGHFYHIGCIRPWLQHRSPCCPMCKEDVRDAYVVLPPIESESSWLRSLAQGIKKLFRRWILCGACRKDRPQDANIPMSQVQSAALEEDVMQEIHHHHELSSPPFGVTPSSPYP